MQLVEESDSKTKAAAPGPKPAYQAKLAAGELAPDPAQAAAMERLQALWQALRGYDPAPLDPPAKPAGLLGREIEVPEAARGVARFDFNQLCGRPLGPADYLAIAEAFHTLVLDNIPRLGPENFDKARRFITCIDTLYEHRCKLVASAAS
ncbi:MAG: AFG1/ZapE family ATPase, partial [Alphaproteobacteria bacterium]